MLSAGNFGFQFTGRFNSGSQTTQNVVFTTSQTNWDSTNDERIPTMKAISSALKATLDTSVSGRTTLVISIG